MSRQCPKCQKTLVHDARFCTGCGQPLTGAAESTAGRRKFCTNCGAPLVAPGAPCRQCKPGAAGKPAPKRTAKNAGSPARRRFAALTVCVLVAAGASAWWYLRPREVWSRDIADRKDLPALRNGGQIVAARQFGPAGFTSTEGLRWQFPLDQTQPPGSALWLAVQDEEAGVWRTTGERAYVSADGKTATGRLFHFSTYAVVTNPEVTVDRRTMRTEWIWLLCEHDYNMEILAKNLAAKYSERLGVAPAILSRPDSWNPEKSQVLTTKPACYAAGVQEFKSKDQELEKKFLESFTAWLAATEKTDLEAVVALYEAAGDFQTLQQVHAQSLASQSWNYVRSKVYDLIVNKIGSIPSNLFDAFVARETASLSTDRLAQLMQVDRRKAGKLQAAVSALGKKKFIKLESGEDGQWSGSRTTLGDEALRPLQEQADTLRGLSQEQVEAAAREGLAGVFGDLEPDRFAVLAQSFVSNADDKLFRLAGVIIQGDTPGVPRLVSADNQRDLFAGLRGSIARERNYFLSLSLAPQYDYVLDSRASMLEWTTYCKAWKRADQALATAEWIDASLPNHVQVRQRMNRRVLANSAEKATVTRRLPVLLMRDERYFPSQETLESSTDSVATPGNITELRQSFQRYQADLDQEIEQGILEYARWVDLAAGGSSEQERARGLLAVRLHHQDLKRCMEEDLVYQAKQLLKSIGEGNSSIPGAESLSYEHGLTKIVKRLRGISSHTRVLLESLVEIGVEGLAWADDKVLKDRLEVAVEELDRRTYDLAGSVLRPKIEPVFGSRKALNEFLQVVACFHSEDCLNAPERADQAARKKLLCSERASSESILEILRQSADAAGWKRDVELELRGTKMFSYQAAPLLLDDAEIAKIPWDGMAEYWVGQLDPAKPHYREMPPLWLKLIAVIDYGTEDFVKSRLYAASGFAAPHVEKWSIEGADEATAVRAPPDLKEMHSMYAARVGRYVIQLSTPSIPDEEAKKVMQQTVQRMRGYIQSRGQSMRRP